MSNEIIYLTAEGMNKLKEELHHMVSVERPQAAQAIAEARDKGDLSENAEYDAAREAQGLLEMRIAQLEATLQKARIIDESKIDTSKVQILSRVKLLNHNAKREMEYTIVSENEANLREGKLAIGTPIAKALLGKKVGDVVEVQVKIIDSAESATYMAAAEFAVNAAQVLNGIRASFWAVAKELSDEDFSSAAAPLLEAANRIVDCEWDDDEEEQE